MSIKTKGRSSIRPILEDVPGAKKSLKEFLVFTWPRNPSLEVQERDFLEKILQK